MAGHKRAIFSPPGTFTRFRSSPAVIFGLTLPTGSTKMKRYIFVIIAIARAILEKIMEEFRLKR